VVNRLSNLRLEPLPAHLRTQLAHLGRNFNDARSGAKMRDLAGQMTLVNLQQSTT
jgi:hypothetical protein